MIKLIKGYKAISDSPLNHKIMHCCVLGIILNYLICIIELQIGIVYTLKHLHIRRFGFTMFYSEKCVTIMYTNLHIQYLLKVNGLTVKWIFMLHIFIIFILTGPLSEHFVRYSSIHFKMRQLQASRISKLHLCIGYCVQDTQ